MVSQFIYVKEEEGPPFARELSLVNTADSYLCFRLALLHLDFYFLLSINHLRLCAWFFILLCLTLRFSRSTHLLMCLPSETLRFTIRTCLPIVVALIDLENSAIGFLSQMTLLMVNFPTPIPDCDSHRPALLDLFFIYLFYNGFPFISKFWSYCLSFHWLSIRVYSQQYRMTHFIALFMTILLLIGMVFVVIWKMFHGRISLDLVLLLVNFVSGFRLELVYISLIKSIRSSIAHLHGFQLLVLLS